MLFKIERAMKKAFFMATERDRAKAWVKLCEKLKMSYKKIEREDNVFPWAYQSNPIFINFGDIEGLIEYIGFCEHAIIIAPCNVFNPTGPQVDFLITIYDGYIES